MEIIKVESARIGNESVNSVNVRDLYIELGVKKDFSSWFKKQIDRLSMIEGQDYLTLKGEKRIDYLITLDVAKNICLMSNTDKGQEVRDYFIKVERQYRQQLAKQANLQLDIQMQRLDALTDAAKGMHKAMGIIDDRLTSLEQNKRLEAWQERKLQDEKNSAVYRIAGDNKHLANKLHQRIWSLFKKRYYLPRYSELPSGKFDDAINYLRSLTIADCL